MLAAFVFAAVLPGFTLAASTPRADYYVLSGTKLKVDPVRCEKFMGRIERKLGTRTPRFSYYRVATAVQVATHHPDRSVALAMADPRNMTVVATSACDTHEMVHLVAFSIGRADKVFEEGLAAMLSGDYTEAERYRQLKRARGMRYRALVQGFVRTVKDVSELNMEYQVSDAWVRHLINRYGMSKFARFLKAHAVANSAYPAFREVYGRDLDTAFDAWMDDPDR